MSPCRRFFTPPPRPARSLLSVVALTAPLLALLSACDPGPSPGAEVALETDVQKASYSIGRNMAGSLEGIVDQVDLPAILRGVSDGLAGIEPALAQEELDAAVIAFQQMLMDAQAAEAAATLAQGEAFLAENGNREGVMTTASGLQYEVLQEGDGASPEAGQQVQVHYRGTLTDGTEFDSSFGGDPASFGLNGVIAGFGEAIMLMRVGGRVRAYIPSALGYGASASSRIPANSVLVFEIELLGVG